jgi:hypothetical protein
VFLHQFDVFEFLEVIRSDGNIEAPNVPSIQTTMDIRRPELVLPERIPVAKDAFPGDHQGLQKPTFRAASRSSSSELGIPISAKW